MSGHEPPAIVVEIRYEYADGDARTVRYLATPDAADTARQPGCVMWRVSAFDGVLPMAGGPIAVEAPAQLDVIAALRAVVAWHEGDPELRRQLARLASARMASDGEDLPL